MLLQKGVGARYAQRMRDGGVAWVIPVQSVSGSGGKRLFWFRLALQPAGVKPWEGDGHLSDVSSAALKSFLSIVLPPSASYFTVASADTGLTAEWVPSNEHTGENRLAFLLVIDTRALETDRIGRTMEGLSSYHPTPHTLQQ